MVTLFWSCLWGKENSPVDTGGAVKGRGVSLLGRRREESSGGGRPAQGLDILSEALIEPLGQLENLCFEIGVSAHALQLRLKRFRAD